MIRTTTWMLLVGFAFPPSTGVPEPAAMDWPTIEACTLQVDLTHPGEFKAEAKLSLSGIVDKNVPVLLNKTLSVDTAHLGATKIRSTKAFRYPSRYFREGRTVVLHLPEVPADGLAEVSMTYSGPAASGTEGPDWRGILFVDSDQVRMCEQTIFYPLIPVDAKGPAVKPVRFTVDVLGPSNWKLYVPIPGGRVQGPTEEVTEAKEGTARWRFASDRPTMLSILGGVRERSDVTAGGLQVVTLLREEHKGLAPEFVRQSKAALQDYGQRFGAVDAGKLGVVEISCRDSSYNWASEGVVTFDQGALGGSVPAKKLAHEIAHLWWGQAVHAAGPGERFLTEGFAEYSAWVHLESAGRSDETRRAKTWARNSVGGLTGDARSDALAKVGFGHRDYYSLAYRKGALVLYALSAQLRPGELDAALKRYRARGADRPTGLEDLVDELRAAPGRAALRVPWLEGTGDLDLAIEDLAVQAGGARVTGTVTATRVPAQSSIDPKGAPVALELGGRGWRERHTILLTGEQTSFDLEAPLGKEGQRLSTAYVRLDPQDGWTRPSPRGLVVLDGASLVTSTPARRSSVEFGGTSLELRFDRPLAPVTMDDLLRRWAKPRREVRLLELRAVVQSEDGKALTLTSDPWRPNTTYAVPLTGLMDRTGLPLHPAAYEFTVLPSNDTQSARVLSSVPANGAEVKAPGGSLALTITFDEPMERGQAITGEGVRDIEARGLLLPDLVGFGTWGPERRSITWPATGLEAGKTYALPIRARGFHDLSRNECEDFDLIFTVVDV